MDRQIWRVLCPFTNQYETIISATEPTVCPSDGVTPLDPAFTTILYAEYYDITSEGYVGIESQLADNQAIKIIASDTNGGIDIDAGLGGITVDTTNSISLNAAAASDFTTTNGNLSLVATAGLVNIDSGSGINLGNNQLSNPINIGTSAFAKTVTIGNLTDATSVNLLSGTGGIHADTANGGTLSLNATGASSNLTLNTNANAQNLTLALLGNTDSSLVIQSTGTGTTALNLNTSQGGIQIVTFGPSNPISIATAYAGSGSINLSSGAGGSGSINLESGAAGISVNAYNGGVIGIGHFSGGDIYFGTAQVSRNIFIGNHVNNTALFTRFGTGGKIEHQGTSTSLSDADASLTSTEILSRIITITPTVNRTLTLPTAASIVAAIPAALVNDSVDFSIINMSTEADTASVTLVPGTGGTLIGNNIVAARSNLSATYFASGSGLFRIQLTNIGSGTESYNYYRVS